MKRSLINPENKTLAHPGGTRPLASLPVRFIVPVADGLRVFLFIPPPKSGTENAFKNSMKKNLILSKLRDLQENTASLHDFDSVTAYRDAIREILDDKLSRQTTNCHSVLQGFLNQRDKLSRTPPEWG